jgi:hypothetical protein
LLWLLLLNIQRDRVTHAAEMLDRMTSLRLCSPDRAARTTTSQIAEASAADIIFKFVNMEDDHSFLASFIYAGMAFRLAARAPHEKLFRQESRSNALIQLDFHTGNSLLVTAVSLIDIREYVSDSVIQI